MRYVNDANAEILTCDDWHHLAPPASASHVVEGRSAFELCRAWMEGDAAEQVTGLLERAGHAGVLLECGVVERRTRFDAIPRGPRHHDLLVTGRSGETPIVVGVEGKADETFGLALDAFVARARRGSPRTRAPERVDRLTTTFFGATLADDPTLGSLRYQLLSALAGTLAEARIAKAPQAVLLVHEFRTDKTRDDRHAANAAALDAFVRRLQPGAARAGNDGAWITDAVTIHGDGTWLPAAAAVRIAKLVTDLRPPR